MWTQRDGDSQDHDFDGFYRSIVEEVLTGSVGISGPAGQVKIWTAYLAPADNRLWFTSQATTEHAQLVTSPTDAGVSIWQAPARWGDPICGVQLEGTVRPVETDSDAEVGLAALHAKFPGTTTTVPRPSAAVGPERVTALFEFVATRATLTNFAEWDRTHYRCTWEDT